MFAYRPRNCSPGPGRLLLDMDALVAGDCDSAQDQGGGVSPVLPPNAESLAQDIVVSALQHTVFTLKDGLQMGWGGRLLPVVGMPISAHNFDTLSVNLISSMFVFSDSTCGSDVASVPSNYDEH